MKLQLPRWLGVTLGTAALIGLALLLSRGTTRGDETLPVEAAAQFWAGNLGALAQKYPVAEMAHRLFWMAEKCLWQGVLQIIAAPLLRNAGPARDALMVVDSVLFMLGALVVMLHRLMRRGDGWALASLTAGALFFASSAVSFFSGGVLECQMSFYAVILAALLDDPVLRGRRAGIVISAALLILCKTYAALVLLPLTYPLWKGRFTKRFVMAGLACAALWAVALFAVADPRQLLADYLGLLGAPTPAGVAQHFLEFFVAFPFGIVWCFPLLAAALFCDAPRRPMLWAKIAGIILLASFLSLFAFWHGGGATAGPRFTPPFLMLLFPELASGLKALLGKWRWAGFAVPLLTALFLPSLDYHNGQVYRWSNLDNDYRQWGEADPLMQPGLLAWRVEFAKARGDETFRPSTRMALKPLVSDIIPMTGLSRIVTAFTDPGADPRLAKARALLSAHGLGHPLFWSLLRAVLAGALLGWMGLAALGAARLQSKPSSPYKGA